MKKILFTCFLSLLIMVMCSPVACYAEPLKEQVVLANIASMTDAKIARSYYYNLRNRLRDPHDDFKNQIIYRAAQTKMVELMAPEINRVTDPAVALKFYYENSESEVHRLAGITWVKLMRKKIIGITEPDEAYEICLDFTAHTYPSLSDNGTLVPFWKPNPIMELAYHTWEKLMMRKIASITDTDELLEFYRQEGERISSNNTLRNASRRKYEALGGY